MEYSFIMHLGSFDLLKNMFLYSAVSSNVIEMWCVFDHIGDNVFKFADISWDKEITHIHIAFHCSISIEFCALLTANSCFRLETMGWLVEGGRMTPTRNCNYVTVNLRSHMISYLVLLCHLFYLQNLQRSDHSVAPLLLPLRVSRPTWLTKSLLTYQATVVLNALSKTELLKRITMLRI